MAKSIKLGSDTYLAAAGVDGIKGTITSSTDLDSMYSVHDSGLYRVNGATLAGSAKWGMMIIVAESGFAIQWFTQASHQLVRVYQSSTWSNWYRGDNTDTGIA